MSQPERAKSGRADARSRILDAAEALANELGPGNISIEAVALRAGLSKGGVLYHFPTKAALLSALVECHIARRRGAVEECLAGAEGRPNALAEALVEACRGEHSCAAPPASGLLAAIAAHPDFLDPLRAHHRATLARLRRESGDPDLATIAFLAIEGMKALHLFGFEALGPEEERAVLGRMAALLRGETAATP
jgi:AcrR family transcriptional regulator